MNDDVTGYFLGDALGSVRQVVDANNEIVLSREYAPYGETLSSLGSFETEFGYTGELTDGTGLINLRARYYDPGTGRFLTKDGWAGDTSTPATLVKWLYANSNPVMYTDPSGYKYDIGSCYGDKFCEKYGQIIADRAVYLINVNHYGDGTLFYNDDASGYRDGNYDYFKRYSENDSEYYYVCADLIRDVYISAGIPLQSMVENIINARAPHLINENLPFSVRYDVLSRNATILQMYLELSFEARDGDSYPYTAGEIVLLGDLKPDDYDEYTDGLAQHTAIVIRGGTSPNQIMLAEISYSFGQFLELSLADFVGLNTPYVYGSNIPPLEDQIQRQIIHGHPSIVSIEKYQRLLYENNSEYPN